MTQRELYQTIWTRPGCHLHRAPGDFYEMVGLIPTPDRRAIQRGPAWGAFQALPAGIDDLEVITYLAGVDKFLLVGSDGSDLVAVSTANLSSFDTVQTLVAAVSSYGGLHARNVVHWGGHLWAIGSNGNIYRGVWDTGLSSLYSTTNVTILAPMNDRMYAVDEDGKVLRLNDAADGMETFWTPTHDLEVIHAAALGSSLILFVQQDNSRLSILKLPDYTSSGVDVRSHQAGTLECAPFNAQDTTFITYNDAIYFTTGRHETADAAAFNIYTFAGAGAAFVARVTASSVSTAAAGFLLWQDELLFYEVLVGNTTVTQTVKILLDDSFVSLEELTGSVRTGLQPITAAIANTIIVTGEDDSDQGFYAADLSTLSDGYLTSAWMSFNTGRIKRLNEIAVILSTFDTDLDITISYRTDNDTDWTVAVTDDETRHTIAPNIGITFYVLQVKVEIADNSGNNVDVQIQSLNVRFTV